MKACAPVVHEATVRAMEVRRFKGSVGSKFYLQCPKCYRKVGPKLDPTDLPEDGHPGDVKWAERPRKGPGNSATISRAKFRSSTKWKNLRARRLDMDDHTCQVCGDPGNSVHHLTDERFGGNERMEDLKTLCGDCHKGEHPEMWGET